MRIAFTTEVSPPKIDGITNRLRNTIPCLLDAGHEVLVFAPAGSDATLGGARVVPIPGPAYPGYPELRATLAHPRIAWELARFRADVLHAVGPVCLGVYGLLAARALLVPTVASYHTDLPRYLPLHGLGFAKRAAWPLIRAVHNRAALNLCPSRATQAELEAHGVRNVEIWRGGVDTELFHPRRRSLAMRSRLTDGRPDRPILLYAGRLSPEKNLELLLPVLTGLPGCHLTLVGDGPARPALERLFASHDVTFTGFLGGEELAAAFASADVFVMPSPTETLGFVVLEAMAAGCPVVAARAGGIPDLVSHGVNGLLFDPRDPDDAGEAIRGLLADRTRARFFAEQGRKSAESATWKRETRDLVWAYRRAIRGARRSLLGGLRHAILG